MNKRKNAKTDAPSTSELVNQANQLLETGRFRDAIEKFKSLIKLQALPEYQVGLAAAYAGRARELSAKGMNKEAIAIWNNRQQFCPQAPLESEHVNILLRHGQIENVLQLLQRNKAQLDTKQLGLIQAQIAAKYLFNTEQIAKYLPAADPIIVHGIAAKNALIAYCNNDDTAVETALAAIPFRSPYRDFVPIIKALLKLNEDRNATEVLLKRIPIESPFMPLVQAITLATLPESAFYSVLWHLQPKISEFAATLRGWSAMRIKLWQELQTLGEKPTVAGLEKFLHKHVQLLGADWVRRQGLRLLIEGFPRSLLRSPIFINDKVTPLEKSIVAAWCAEGMKSAMPLLHAWQQVIAILRTSNPAPDSDDGLNIALIQRQIEQKLDLLNQQPEDDFFFHYLKNQLPDLVAEGRKLLEESLLFDPNDLPTYVRLITHYRTNKQLKDTRRLLNTALERWPNEPALLVEAIELSTTSGAFKKATGFARRLLELDPINNRARESLLESHLAHFRKQVRNGSFALAEKELTATEIYIRDKRTQLKFNIARSFLTLKRAYAEGIASFKELLNNANTSSNLAQQLALIVEAKRMGVQVTELMQTLALALPQQLDIHDFLLFLRLLREALEQKDKLPEGILDYFTPAIKRAKDLQLPQEDCELLCSTLHKCGLNKLYRLHAGAALARWPGLPIFELHYFEAKYSHTPYKATSEEVQRLESAEQRAWETGDARLANRINKILDRVKMLTAHRHESSPFDSEAIPNFDNPRFEQIFQERGIDGLLEEMQKDPEKSKILKDMEQIMDQQSIRRMLEMILAGVDREEGLNELLPQLLPRKKSRKPSK